MNLIQTIIVRDDLGFTPGLMAAQVAHIHAQIMRTTLRVSAGQIGGPLTLTENMVIWLEAPYIHVRKVPNIETLDWVIKQAEETDGVVSLNKWRDTVNCKITPDFQLTFDTLIGVSLGPADSDKIKKIAGQIPFL